jgi:predicted DNA-binding antitoxin AbrB/MazE fold protein
LPAAVFGRPRRRYTTRGVRPSSPGTEATPLTIEAVYENGVLKPAQPLPLKEHEKVRITVEPELSWAERTAGMLPWTGDPEVLRRVAEDDEFGILESP